MSTNPQIILPRLHPKQIAMASARQRFNYCAIGRQFGKTSFLEWGLCMQAINTHSQLIAAFYPSPTEYLPVWDNVKHILAPFTAKTNENERWIRLKNGSQIDFWSSHKKDKGRGRHYHHVWVDEACMHLNLQYLLEYVIHATLLRYKGDLWVLSSPHGFDYFQSIFIKQQPNTALFKFTTYDNPYIDPAEIELAKERLPDVAFRQEYLAEFVQAGNRFAYAFDENKHVGQVQYNPNAVIIISFDFNIDPITAIAAQHYGNNIHILHEFRIMNGTIPQICAAIKQKYPDVFRLEITGDPAGWNRQIASIDAVKHYQLIQRELGIRSAQIKAAHAQSTHKSSRLILNTILHSFPNFTINPTCKHLIEDLHYVQSDAHSHIVKETTGESKLKTHLLDCLINYLHTYHSKYVPHIIINR